MAKAMLGLNLGLSDDEDDKQSSSKRTRGKSKKQAKDDGIGDLKDLLSSKDSMTMFGGSSRTGGTGRNSGSALRSSSDMLSGLMGGGDPLDLLSREVSKRAEKEPDPEEDEEELRFRRELEKEMSLANVGSTASADATQSCQTSAVGAEAEDASAAPDLNVSNGSLDDIMGDILDDIDDKPAKAKPKQGTAKVKPSPAPSAALSQPLEGAAGKNDGRNVPQAFGRTKESAAPDDASMLDRAHIEKDNTDGLERGSPKGSTPLDNVQDDDDEDWSDFDSASQKSDSLAKNSHNEEDNVSPAPEHDGRKVEHVDQHPDEHADEHMLENAVEQEDEPADGCGDYSNDFDADSLAEKSVDAQHLNSEDSHDAACPQSSANVPNDDEDSSKGSQPANTHECADDAIDFDADRPNTNAVAPPINEAENCPPDSHADSHQKHEKAVEGSELELPSEKAAEISQLGSAPFHVEMTLDAKPKRRLGKAKAKQSSPAPPPSTPAPREHEDAKAANNTGTAETPHSEQLLPSDGAALERESLEIDVGCVNSMGSNAEECQDNFNDFDVDSPSEPEQSISENVAADVQGSRTDADVQHSDHSLPTENAPTETGSSKASADRMQSMGPEAQETDNYLDDFDADSPHESENTTSGVCQADAQGSHVESQSETPMSKVEAGSSPFNVEMTLDAKPKRRLSKAKAKTSPKPPQLSPEIDYTDDQTFESAIANTNSATPRSDQLLSTETPAPERESIAGADHDQGNRGDPQSLPMAHSRPPRPEGSIAMHASSPAMARQGRSSSVASNREGSSAPSEVSHVSWHPSVLDSSAPSIDGSGAEDSGLSHEPLDVELSIALKPKRRLSKAKARASPKPPQGQLEEASKMAAPQSVVVADVSGLESLPSEVVANKSENTCPEVGMEKATDASSFDGGQGQDASVSLDLEVPDPSSIPVSVQEESDHSQSQSQVQELVSNSIALTKSSSSAGDAIVGKSMTKSPPVYPQDGSNCRLEQESARESPTAEVDENSPYSTGTLTRNSHHCLEHAASGSVDEDDAIRTENAELKRALQEARAALRRRQEADGKQEVQQEMPEKGQDEEKYENSSTKVACKEHEERSETDEKPSTVAEEHEGEETSEMDANPGKVAEVEATTRPDSKTPIINSQLQPEEAHSETPKVVNSVPPKPAAPTIQVISSTHACVSWVPVQHEPIVRGYALVVQEVFGFTGYFDQRSGTIVTNSAGVPPISAHANTVVIGGLSMGLEYVAAIAAVNEVGWSDFSTPSEAIALNVPGVPSQPSVKLLDHSRAHVSWTATSTSQGVIGYSVCLAEQRRQRYYDFQSKCFVDEAVIAKPVPADETAIVIDKLVACIGYKVRIAALNGVGWSKYSPFSNVFQIDVPRKPSSPKAEPVSDASIRISWSLVEQLPKVLAYAVAVQTADASVEHYDMQSGRLTAKFEKSCLIPADRDSIIVTSLARGESYKAKVAAMNHIGFCDYSSLSAPAVIDVPQKPEQIPLLEVINDTSIRVSWTSKASSHAIVCYSVAVVQSDCQRSTSIGRLKHACLKYYDIKTGMLTEDTVGLSPIPADITSIVIGGLSLGMSYKAKFAARNRIGWSRYSAFSESTTIREPDALCSPMLRVIDNSSIHISWKPGASLPKTTGYAIAVYDCQHCICKYLDSKTGHLVVNSTDAELVSPDSRSAIVTGLTHGVNFKAQVAVVNTVGRSHYSEFSPEILLLETDEMRWWPALPIDLSPGVPRPRTMASSCYRHVYMLRQDQNERVASNWEYPEQQSEGNVVRLIESILQWESDGDLKCYHHFMSQGCSAVSAAVSLWAGKSKQEPWDTNSSTLFVALNRMLLRDDAEDLTSWMCIIKAAINHITCPISLCLPGQHSLHAWRGSHLTRRQANDLRAGEIICPPMFVAASMSRKVAEKFQSIYLVELEIPVECLQAGFLHKGQCANTGVVMLVPYAPIQVIEVGPDNIIRVNVLETIEDDHRQSVRCFPI